MKEVFLNVSPSESVKSPVELGVHSLDFIALSHKGISVPKLRREHVCNSVGSDWHDHFRACLVIPTKAIKCIGLLPTNIQAVFSIEDLVCCCKQLYVVCVSFSWHIWDILTSLSNWVCREISSEVSSIRIVDHCHASKSIGDCINKVI
jgi:hypothetical protein